MIVKKRDETIFGFDLDKALSQQHEEYIRQALTATRGNINLAAKTCEVERTTFWHRVKRFGIDAEEYKK